MTTQLILAAVIILCCILFNKVSDKLGLPMLLLFILLGMAFGSDGIMKIPFDNYSFAENMSTAALLIIIFYGGFGTKWSKAKKAAGKSLLLSSAGVIITAALVGIFCKFILGFSTLEGLLTGAVVSSTDAASVFSILRSKKLNLKYHTAPILELESGSNDPWAYMMTIIILSLMRGNSSGGEFVKTLFCQLAFGIIFGALIAFLGAFAIKRINFDEAGFDAIFVCAIAILSYALPASVGGNGYLSAYIVGIVMGNTKIPNKKALVHFFDGITGITQIFLFFMLGLLAFPSQMPRIILPAAAIAVFLIFVARPIAVFGILKPFKAPLNQILLVSFAGLRGATSVVFAIMVTADSAYTKHDIFHIVFMIVLISIGLQGSLLPFIAKKTDMIDDSENVMKTFNDYSDETAVQFIRLIIDKDSDWAFKKLSEITLPKGLLAVMILRENQKIIPDGATLIKDGDTVILSAEGFYDDSSFILNEMTLEKENDWCGKNISEIDLPDGGLIVIIKRSGNILVPNGQIALQEDDTLVMASSK